MSRVTVPPPVFDLPPKPLGRTTTVDLWNDIRDSLDDIQSGGIEPDYYADMEDE